MAPEEIRKRFQHHHEWDACPMVAEPGDSQEPLKEGEVGSYACFVCAVVGCLWGVVGVGACADNGRMVITSRIHNSYQPTNQR